jgi:ubiquinone biosynthesis protein
VLTEQGLKLHPDTVAAMRGRGGKGGGSILKNGILLWVAIIALAVAVILK